LDNLENKKEAETVQGPWTGENALRLTKNKKKKKQTKKTAT